MRKIYLLFLVILLFLTSCRQGISPNPTVSSNLIASPNNEGSDTEVSELARNNTFREDDVCVKLLNSVEPRNVLVHSSAAFSDGKYCYLTYFLKNKLYRYDQNGEKEFIIDDAWNCFIKDGVFYYEDWGGATNLPFNLAMLVNGKKTIIFKDCTTVYGETAIYCDVYTSGNQYDLYSIDYGTHKSSFIAKLLAGQYFDAEYSGYLWYLGKDGLNRSNLNGTGNELILPGCMEVVGYRNNFIYFLDKDNNFRRFSIQENETISLPNPFVNGIYTYYAYNFTDDYFLLASKDGLYAYDSNFQNKKKLLDNDRISAIYSMNDTIIIKYDDKDDNDHFERIDDQGNILQTFN